MLDSVFITGGSRGIGEGLVRHFSKLGKRVAFTYHNSEEKALLLADELGAFPIQCDVSQNESVIAAINTAKNKIGNISVLINNVGICKSQLLCDTAPETWHSIQSTNIDGMYYTIKAVLPMLLQQPKGRIINISSVWGVYGAACEVAYSTSKAACIGLTKSLAKELGASGITVNAIAPGVIDTDMNRCYSKEDMELILADIPLGRMGTADEVAQLVGFLASENADYITGQVIGIDGGFC